MVCTDGFESVEEQFVDVIFDLVEFSPDQPALNITSLDKILLESYPTNCSFSPCRFRKDSVQHDLHDEIFKNQNLRGILVITEPDCNVWTIEATTTSILVDMISWHRCGITP